MNTIRLLTSSRIIVSSLHQLIYLFTQLLVYSSPRLLVSSSTCLLVYSSLRLLVSSSPRLLISSFPDPLLPLSPHPLSACPSVLSFSRPPPVLSISPHLPVASCFQLFSLPRLPLVSALSFTLSLSPLLRPHFPFSYLSFSPLITRPTLLLFLLPYVLLFSLLL